MSKTKIEWCDYTINPVKGLCPVGCSYCYARRMYKRFKWNTEIKFNIDWMDALPGALKPSKIFTGSTMELFGDWIKPAWIRDILQVVSALPWHTFIFLTKQPQNLTKWSPFPENCWVGVTATNEDTWIEALHGLYDYEARVKFISFEPLLNRIILRNLNLLDPKIINWIIIGQQTPPSVKTQPKIEWIREIVEAAGKAKIPVFLKDNLAPLMLKGKTAFCKLKQEFPE